MKELIIEETSKGFFSVLLPLCDASVLAKILDPTLPWVTLVDFTSQEACSWIENNLPPLFDANRHVESIVVKKLQMNVALQTLDFLQFLPLLIDSGLELVQATRPLPQNLNIHSLKPESKSYVFRQAGIELLFDLPIAPDNALVASPSMTRLKKVVASVSAE